MLCMQPETLDQCPLGFQIGGKLSFSCIPSRRFMHWAASAVVSTRTIVEVFSFPHFYTASWRFRGPLRGEAAVYLLKSSYLKSSACWLRSQLFSLWGFEQFGHELEIRDLFHSQLHEYFDFRSWIRCCFPFIVTFGALCCDWSLWRDLIICFELSCAGKLMKAKSVWCESAAAVFTFLRMGSRVVN